MVANSGFANTLELASGASTGTLSGLGTQFTGFQTIDLDAGADWVLPTETSAATIAFGGNAGILEVNDIAGFAGTVSAIHVGDEIVVTGGTLSGLAVSNGRTLTVNDGGTTDGTSGTDTIVFGLAIQASDFTISNGDTITFVACFAPGTGIATETGERPVETLRARDVLRTADGRQRPVRWIGRRHIDLTRHPAPEEVRPIRIQAGALAPNVPVRDLVVSPEHAMFLDGGLVPARFLLNGMSIRQEAHWRSVTWYHVELDSHDILLADGAPAESYLDTGNRGMFENADEPLVLHPNFADGQAGRVGRSCAPFLDHPDVLKPIWDRLVARALDLGFAPPPPGPMTGDPALVLQAGTRVFQPVSARDGRYLFALPALGEAVRLVSRVTAPSWPRPWLTDRRTLGVAVRRITLRYGDEVETIPPDHPALAEGWWPVERDVASVWRWTNGGARLPLTLGRPVILELEVDTMEGYAMERAESMVA